MYVRVLHEYFKTYSETIKKVIVGNSLDDNACYAKYTIEAFPKLQFWENNLEIRDFARL
jgi:hypothetical protein